SVCAGSPRACGCLRAPGDAGTPVAAGSAGPITPKPATSRTAPGSLVVAFTSSRERATRQMAVTGLMLSAGFGVLTPVIVVSADDVAHADGSDHGVQLLASTRNFSTVPSGMFWPLTNLSTVKVIRGTSCGVPNGVAPGSSATRCAKSPKPSGVWPSAPTCHQV